MKKSFVVKFTNPGLIRNGERTRNRHHRRPKSRGGRRTKGNISTVLSSAHFAFHFFFNFRNGKPMDTKAIARRLGVLYPMIKAFFVKEDGTLKTEEEILRELNKIWLDPKTKLVDKTPEGGLATTPTKTI